MAQDLVQAQFPFPPRPQAGEEQKTCEPVYIGMPIERPPVEPTDVIVLAIGVVVPALRAPNFVTHDEPGPTESEDRQRQKVSHLPIAQALDGWVISRTFRPAIPAQVEVGPIPIVLPVRRVVFPVVRDQVVECEPVMTRHEIDALLGFPFLLTVEIRA